MTQSLDYYRHREAQERLFAGNAQSEMARKIHIELAERYARLTGGEAEPIERLRVIAR